MKTIKYIISMSCALHCLVTPFLILLLPALQPFVDNHWVEFGILSVSLLAGLGIIYSGYCSHKKQHALWLFAAGALCWGVHALGEHLDLPILNTLFLIGGSVFILSSYFINHRASKPCEHHHH